MIQFFLLMNTTYLLLFSACFIFFGHSQAQLKKTVTVKAGSSIAETVATGDLFLYPQFIDGVIFYKSGKAGSARLNYNLLTDEMQFVSPKNDTLTIPAENTIEYMVIGKDSFYYDKGYLQLTYSDPLVKLAKKQRVKIIGREKIGAYGQSGATSAIDNYDHINTRTGLQKLTVRQDIILGWEDLLYIGDENKQFAIANKKNVLDMLPQYRDIIKDYLKANDVNFKREADMIRLINHLQAK